VKQETQDSTCQLRDRKAKKSGRQPVMLVTDLSFT